MSGSAAERVAVVTASARSLPALTYAMDAGMEANMTCTCPPSRSTAVKFHRLSLSIDDEEMRPPAGGLGSAFASFGVPATTAASQRRSLLHRFDSIQTNYLLGLITLRCEVLPGTRVVKCLRL